MEKRIFKIFVDFDGTITKQDVGELMFKVFGDPVEAEKIVQQWIDNKISSMETWQRLCETVKNFDTEKFAQFLDTISIDETFRSFTGYCAENGFEIRILSDGLDYYIDRILERENLADIERYTNKLGFSNGNDLVPSFPYTDEECRACANCKRNHVIEYSSDDDNEFSIYIGDGYSDTCPAKFCDFIFAKNSLLKYCELNRITYFPYSNFDDVVARLEELRLKKRLKKKHQAGLKRKEVYLQG